MESLIKHFAFVNLSKEKILISESIHPEEESSHLHDLAILIPVLSQNSEENDFSRLHTESGTWISILANNRNMNLLLLGSSCPIKWGIELLRKLKSEIEIYGDFEKNSDPQKEKVLRKINRIIFEFMENPEVFVKNQKIPSHDSNNVKEMYGICSTQPLVYGP